ncbi:MAG: DPP IV N-terminal domain-containing protein [Anaerolineae bacterium]
MVSKVRVPAARKAVTYHALPIALCLLLAACGVPMPSPTATQAVTAPPVPATVVLAETGATAIPTEQATPSATPVPTAGGGTIAKPATATVAPAAATPVATAVPGQGLLLFASTRDGCYGEQLYALDVETKVATRLTGNCDAAYRSPSWSPDGTQVAFIMAQAGSSSSDIYIMSASGGDAVRLTSDGADKISVAWSPDGSRLAFAANTADAGADVFVIGVDGSGLVRLTDAPFDDYAPGWSPDGERIVFRSERDMTYEIGDIYVMDADGSGQRRLTTDEDDDAWPVFSPDGSTIVFASNRDDPEGVACWHTRHWCNYELYAMSADGSGQRRLTDSDELETTPAWSADGTHIAFAAALSSGSYDVYLMAADGSGRTALTSGYAGGTYLSWSPDAAGLATLPTAAPFQAMVTPTGRPTVVPSAFAIAPELAEAAAMTYAVPVYYGYKGDTGVNGLGAPLAEAQPVSLARQWFGPFDASVCRAEDSLMLWRGDTREIAYLLQGTSGSSEDCYPDYWLVFEDTWQAGEANNEGETAPAGYYVPVMGFGKVWRQIRSEQLGAIGFATTEERHGDGVLQRFENGVACYFVDSDEVYILFDRFRRIDLRGPADTRAWFQVR